MFNALWSMTMIKVPDIRIIHIYTPKETASDRAAQQRDQTVLMQSTTTTEQPYYRKNIENSFKKRRENLQREIVY